MPLTLVTGPANSAKAGEVLDAVRACRARGPLLVVPTGADVRHYQRELAGSGAATGVRVLPFAGLVAEVAGRAGYAAPVAGTVTRQRVMAAAATRARPRLLAASARSPGFVREALRLVAELHRARVEPEALRRAARAGGDGIPAHLGEVADLYAEYRRGLDDLGRVDPELLAWRALDALRLAPGAWGDTPVFLYGFDDLTEAELDAVETLARRAEAEVTVALSHEPGRRAFASRARAFEWLRPLADRHVELPPDDRHYAPTSRAALHHLERRLFEDEPGERLPAGHAVRVLEAGGERAEAELVAAEVLRLVRAGTPPERIAVVWPSLDRAGPLAEQVLGAYGVPFSLERRVPLAHTALGRGLLALLRCALADGPASELLAYLRTPGRLDRVELVDRLEAQVRREGIRTARGARERWEGEHWPLDALDRLAAASEAGPAALAERAAEEASRLFERPHLGQAHRLDGDERVDARALATVRAALGEAAELGRRSPRLGAGPAELVELLEGLEVRVGEAPAPGRVHVSDPMGLRARRYAAVFACGLQDGDLPRAPASPPFLDDEDRRALARAAGILLPWRADPLGDERSLFYALASRAEERLVLSHRTSDEEGNVALPSPFLADVAAVFDGPLERVGRTLADVTWSPAAAPTARELERATVAAGPRTPPPPLGPLRSDATVRGLGAEEPVSAGAVEAFAACPVKWFVDKHLRPRPLDGDNEFLRRGSFAHAALAATLGRLRERTGSARLDPGRLPEAEAILAEVVAELAVADPLDPDPARAALEARAIEAAMRRVLSHEAARDDGFEPAELELGFGRPEHGDQLPALELRGGAVRISGQIDRVDVEAGDGRALVRDYKTRVDRSPPGARWEPDDQLQVPLYLLAVRQLLGREVAGGVYQPITAVGEKLRPRGMVVQDAVRDPAAYVEHDVVEAGTLAAALEWAEARAGELVDAIRSGSLAPTPATCTPNGGCQYPGVCRCEP